jgi:Ca2+-transporting ATPase
MTEGPRKSDEPLITKLMIIGIAIQTVVLTSLCIGGYILGLQFYVGTAEVLSSYSNIPSHFIQTNFDAANVQHEVEQAQTISLLLIVFAELLRAFGARSLRESMFTVGFTKNKWMLYSVFGSMILTVIIYFIPGLNNVLGLYEIDGRGWGVVMVGMFIPLIIEEITKFFFRFYGLGERVKTVRYSRK